MSSEESEEEESLHFSASSFSAASLSEISSVAIATLIVAGDDSSTYILGQYKAKGAFKRNGQVAYVWRVPLVLFSKTSGSFDGVDAESAAHDLDTCREVSRIEPIKVINISLSRPHEPNRNLHSQQRVDVHWSARQ